VTLILRSCAECIGS